MTFQALLVSKDDEAAAMLTSVLSRFGLGVSSCGYPEALVRLGEQRFDAVIVDFDDPHSASLILQNASQPTSGSSAVTVALLSDKTKVRNVFGAGANFVLYKPISEQHAQASLRAATALIKRERRRSYRVPVQLPVQVQVQNGPEMEGILLDLSEDGMDLLAAQPLFPSAVISVHFVLPDGSAELDVRGEIAWANPNGQSGVRFVDVAEGLRSTLRNWVAANSPEIPPDDPEPLSRCRLTDLSLGGCYVETESPFPEKSGITLCLRTAALEVQAQGTVRVMHPEFGMGIEFASRTQEDRDQVARFIEFLTSRPGTQPELLISPRSLVGTQGEDQQPESGSELEDSLLHLLRHHETLSQDEFLQELRNQRNSEEVTSS